jgi:hypothetical protein
MRLLLDSHTLLWVVDDLSPGARPQGARHSGTQPRPMTQGIESASVTMRRGVCRAGGKWHTGMAHALALPARSARDGSAGPVAGAPGWEGAEVPFFFLCALPSVPSVPLWFVPFLISSRSLAKRLAPP